jgi:hypothetical protein
MACTRQSWLIDKLLNDFLDPGIVKHSDALSGFRSAAIRADSILKTWNFFKSNWDKLFAKHGSNLAPLIKDFSFTFNTQFLFDDVNFNYAFENI